MKKIHQRKPKKEKPASDQKHEDANEESTKKSKKQKKEGKQIQDDDHTKQDEQETTESTPNPTKKSKKQKKEAEQTEIQTNEQENDANKKDKVPFKRIKEDGIFFTDERLADNRYEAKGGDEYGKKAASDLIKVRGKDFRHAKTKKKKGTYKGGIIDMGVNSIKFHYSSEEE